MIEYSLFEETLTLDRTTYLSYGVAIFEDDIIIRKINDVSVDYISVNKLIALCNDEQLEPIHIDEIIDDYLQDFNI